MNLRSELDRRVRKALATVSGLDDAPAIVMPSARPQFGDYQVNGVMAVAKRLKTDPRKLAEKVASAVDLADIAEGVEIAGAGFINIHIKDEFLANQLAIALKDDHTGVPKLGEAQTIVVDFSGPNLAKEMHVGHLRSTIIGDAMARTLEFLGHDVIRQNHVGDWGTQFGMLIANIPKSADLDDLKLTDLEAYYVEAKQRFDNEPEFADRARKIVTELHKAGPNAWKTSDVILRWLNFRRATLEHCYEVYGLLDVWFTPKEFRGKWQPHGPGQIASEIAPAEQTGIVGESFYNDDLPGVVADLKTAGLLTKSHGAQCVFLDEFTGKDGEPLPLIVQKSDGGYLYATTDLAAIRYRINQLHANRIIYVTDARQSLHFSQVFAVAGKAGFSGEEVSLEHVAFGMMLGADGKPFRTREGGTVKLTDLLEEARQRAFELVSEKNPNLDEQRRRDIASAVGIGAIKYADLAQNRTSDYVFSWEKMLSLDGNTAPYMQYAYARVRSIFRKGGLDNDTVGGKITLADPAERRLAIKLAQFPETVEAIAAECMPNFLCSYLYDLAGAFMSFYENCPVLQSKESIRSSRLELCLLTARTIKTGLGLLGIETLEQM